MGKNNNKKKRNRNKSSIATVTNLATAFGLVQPIQSHGRHERPNERNLMNYWDEDFSGDYIQLNGG